MSDLPVRRVRERRRWSSSAAVAGISLFVALGGTAAATNGVLHAGKIAAGSITSKQIKDGTVTPADLSTKTSDMMARLIAEGGSGAVGATGPAGAAGANGLNGLSGVNGANGPDGTNGTNGAAWHEWLERRGRQQWHERCCRHKRHQRCGRPERRRRCRWGRRDRRGRWDDCSDLGDCGCDAPAHSQLTRVRRQRHSSGGELRDPGEDAALSHGSRRFHSLQPEGRRRDARSDRRQDAACPGCCPGFPADRCDDFVAHLGEPRLQCRRCQRSGHLQQSHRHSNGLRSA